MGTPEPPSLRRGSAPPFRIDLHRPPHSDLWLLLGEAQAKCDQLERSLLRPQSGADLHKRYLAHAARATAAIEGDGLTEEEALAAVEGRLRLPASRDYLRREVENVLAAYTEVMTKLLGVDKLTLRLSFSLIAGYNRQVLRGLDLDAGVVPGKIRTRRSPAPRRQAPPVEQCQALVERLCQWLEGPDLDPPSRDQAVAFGIARALLAHLYLVWIRPFGDGNEATARVLEFQLLVAAGIPGPAAHLLSIHYHATRGEYDRQLDRVIASGGRGDVLRFLTYALRGFVDGLNGQLERVWSHQFQERWEQYVDERFGPLASTTERRRRRLMLAISARPDPVPRSQVRGVSPEVATLYAGRTDKTLTRDLNALQGMGLLKRRPEGFVPVRDQILALMPVKRPAGTDSTRASRPG